MSMLQGMSKYNLVFIYYGMVAILIVIILIAFGTQGNIKIGGLIVVILIIASIISGGLIFLFIWLNLKIISYIILGLYSISWVIGIIIIFANWDKIGDLSLNPTD